MERAQTTLGLRHNAGYPLQPFGISQSDRLRHCAVIGRTGVGKSTLLWNIALQDISAGRGVAFFDPHGDVAKELLDHIPASRRHDVVYFNAADLEYPFALNPLHSNRENHLVVSAVVDAFKHHWKKSWGPRTEYNLANALATLVEHGNMTLQHLPRLFTDPTYRSSVLRRVRNPNVLAFWEDEYPSYTQSLRTESIAPIQNKLGRLLAVPPIRNMLCQPKMKVDFRHVIDRGQIFIANLSKGQFGADNANLVGSLLLSQFQVAAMSRSELAEGEREGLDYHLIIDEFHSIATSALAEMLSDLRKYRVSLTLGTQFLDQVEEETRAAILGDVETLIAFGVGPSDAEILAKYFAPTPPRELVGLAPFEIYARTPRLEPTIAKTLPPSANYHGHGKGLVNFSRERFARRREDVENKLGRWFENRAAP